MQTGVGADRVQSGGAQAGFFFVRVVVHDGCLHFVEVEDQLLADDVLDGRPEGDVVVTRQSGHGGVGAGTLGEKVFGGGLAGRGVLGDRGLDAVDCEPVRCAGGGGNKLAD